MTIQLRAASSTTARPGARVSRRLLDAGAKLERSALCRRAIATEQLRPLLAELSADHFYDDRCTARSERHLVDGTPLDEAGIGLLAELDAYAEAEGIGEADRHELLLRLRERELQRELRAAPVERRSELTEALAEAPRAGGLDLGVNATPRAISAAATLSAAC